MVFQLLLAFFRLVVLSKRWIIEPSLTAFIGCPFALVFTCTFTEYITYITKYMSSTGIIRNFGRLADCDPISNPCLNADCDPISIKTVLRNLEGKKTEARVIRALQAPRSLCTSYVHFFGFRQFTTFTSPLLTLKEYAGRRDLETSPSHAPLTILVSFAQMVFLLSCR